MTLVDFQAAHLDGVLDLCRAEGWPSLPSDPGRALRVLTCGGGRTVVAVDQTLVVGLCQVLSDGELQAYCSLLLVGAQFRRQGLGRTLLLTALERAGGERLDLLAETTAVDFYRKLRHHEWAGFRIYPEPLGE
ncbi:MAG TPA: GNAT family N-acetyltransferase [Candidatus Nanopelagicaceae bacterium]|nr:GNAT family N-acetyltransferase [Candidatus Nanopelagicaceae bacterium]